MKSDTRARLVEAARELFLQQGYGATGVAQILNAADANSGSLYYFFPTKEDLLHAVLEKYKEMLYPMVMQPVFARVTDPIERVFGVLDGYRQMLIITQCGVGCPIGNLALEVADSLPAARELVAENFVGWRDAIKLCVDAAADRLPEGTDPERVAWFVLTTMEGGVMLSRTFRSLEPFDCVVTSLRDYFERLLADGTSWTGAKRATTKAKSKTRIGNKPKGKRSHTRRKA